MLDSYNQQQIEKISYEILKRSKSLDVFPTPVDQIVTYADLIIAQHIDLSQMESSFFERMNDNAKSFLSRIRGILDRREKTIYLDLSLPPTKRNFIKLHETGHELLPWQKAILNCLDDDNNLSPTVRDEFEAEANFFASLTLFQCDRFDSKMKKLPLGIQAAMHLSKTFGSSVHAALRKYVERHSKRCALIVLEKTEIFPDFKCKVKDYFQSSQFEQTFGELEWDEVLDLEQGYSFVEQYSFGKKFKLDGTLSLETANGIVDFEYHYFNNTFNAFVLLFPIGESKPTRTKIIITGIEK